MIDQSDERLGQVALLLRDAAGAPVRLPTLSVEQLASLGTLEAAPWRDGEELTWWRGMADATRTAVGAAAVRGLAARGLMDVAAAPGEQGELPTAPELSLLVSVRNQPAWIVIGGEPEGGPRGRHRLYGLESEESAGWALTETVDDAGVHSFTLAAAETALAALTSWACAPATLDDAGQPSTVFRTLEVIRRGDDAPVSNRMVIVGGTEGVAAAPVDGEGRTGDLEKIDDGGLRARLLRLVQGS